MLKRKQGNAGHTCSTALIRAVGHRRRNEIRCGWHSSYISTFPSLGGVSQANQGQNVDEKGWESVILNQLLMLNSNWVLQASQISAQGFFFLNNLPLTISAEKEKETDDKTLEQTPLPHSGSWTGSLLSSFTLTGEEDHHLQVTQRSRHLHTDVSVISDINSSRSCRLVSSPARHTLCSTASIGSCCLSKWKRWIVGGFFLRVEVREFRHWLAGWTENVLSCLAALFDCIVCDPQETLNVCHVAAETQSPARFSLAWPGPARHGPAWPLSS